MILSILTVDLMTLPPRLVLEVSLIISQFILLPPSSPGLNLRRYDYISALESLVVGTYSNDYLTGEFGLFV
jgi:hypothetical protein